MIIMHKSLKRSDDIMRSFRRFCEVNFKTLDGVIEVFNNKIGQGYLIKVFQSYNKNNDLVVWLFESLKDKNIKIAFSNHSNIDEHNTWIDKNKVNIKTYSIVKDIKKTIINDIYDIVKDYYGLNEEIEYTNDLKIQEELCIQENKKLSDIIYEIANFVKNYEIKEQNEKLKINDTDEKLYKLKEILELYPMLTTYSVNKAVNEKRLTSTQLGKTRFYKKKDIEAFLESNQRDAFKYRKF